MRTIWGIIVAVIVFCGVVYLWFGAFDRATNAFVSATLLVVLRIYLDQRKSESERPDSAKE